MIIIVWVVPKLYRLINLYIEYNKKENIKEKSMGSIWRKGKVILNLNNKNNSKEKHKKFSNGEEDYNKL